MDNKKFNKRLTKIFNNNVSNQKLISELVTFWLNNSTTNEQDEILENLKQDILKDNASSVRRYLLKE